MLGLGSYARVRTIFRFRAQLGVGEVEREALELVPWVLVMVTVQVQDLCMVRILSC